MKEAVAFIQNGNPLRKAARLYNVPVETLIRRVNETVSLKCKPGPSTVLTKEEECLAKYVIVLTKEEEEYLTKYVIVLTKKRGVFG